MGSLLAFRHAEASVNRPDLFVTGKGDHTYSLTKTGVAQAQKAGAWAIGTFDWIRNGDFAAAVSQFVRAQQTFEYMGLPQAPLIISAGLIEHDWGAFMGSRPPEDLRPSFDVAYEICINVKAPGGESTLDLYRRTNTTLHELVDRFPGKQLVIVAHGRTLAVLRMIIERIPATDRGWEFVRKHNPELPNCGALYYPDFQLLAETVPNRIERVAVVDPPYCPLEHFRWQPYMHVTFDTRH